MDSRALRHVFGFSRSNEQVTTNSKFHFDNAFRPFPQPTGEFPFHLDLQDVLGGDAAAAIGTSGKMVFHAVGDTGNLSHGADAQNSVAFHMEQQLNVADAVDKPQFFYHLGDVVYYNGERSKYEAQFYEPYLFYTSPIVAIAGNHDAANVDPEQSLQGFMENFCDSQPRHTGMAGQSNRTTMIQPNVYWTFVTPLATFIGLYSNVNGKLDKQSTQQQDWFTSELRKAATDRPAIVTVHHPPYSLDDTHGGHQPIVDALDQAFAAANRIPNLVLTGHVHNYQRFERTMPQRAHPLQYLVAGAGGFAGYSNLHQLKTQHHPDRHVKLKQFETKSPGFLRITVTRKAMQCEYFKVPSPPNHMSAAHPAELVESVAVPF